jgi:hypothetical protein
VFEAFANKTSATGPTTLGGSCLGDCHALHVRETARHHGHLLRRHMLAAPCDDRRLFRITFQAIHKAFAIGAFATFSLTAIPCRMHRISFDLRSERLQFRSQRRSRDAWPYTPMEAHGVRGCIGPRHFFQKRARAPLRVCGPRALSFRRDRRCSTVGML